MINLDFSLDGCVVEPDLDEPPRYDRPGERMHMLHETVFGRLGPILRENGWSCFPQQNSERRKPAVVDKVTLKWKPFQTRLPTEYEMRSWSLQCPGENVAVITGAASGGSPTADGLACSLFALDLDINTADLAWAVRAVANRVLGESPFLRFGRVPRCVMFYRHHTSMKLARRSFKFGEWVDGKWVASRSDDALEILANGSPVTAFGVHHKTGDYFKWPDSHPMLQGPEAAPLVTKAQLDAFLTAVEEVRRFYSKRTVVDGDTRTSNFDAGAAAFDPTAHGLMPDMNREGDWVEEDGIVTDGAHNYLLAYTRRLVCANGHAFGDDALPEAGMERREADRAALEALARKHVKEALAIEYKESRQKVVAKFEAMLKDTITGFRARRDGLLPIHTSQGSDGRYREAARLTTAFARDGSLHWLGERSNTSGLTITTAAERRSYVRGFVSGYSEEAAKQRALGQDRSAAIRKVVDANVAAAKAFLADVEARKASVHLNMTPMGAGKTTTTVGEVVGLLQAEEAAGIPYQGPFVFLQQSHQLIGESVLVAMRHGVRFQIHIPNGADAAVAEIEAAGLRGVHLKSKLLAGCERRQALEYLHEAGLRSSGLCKSDLVDADGHPVFDEHGNPVPDVCPFSGMCGYHRMLEQLKTAHIVFAPHFWLTKTVNESLLEPRGLVIDESVVHSIVQVAFVPVAALSGPRPDPELTGHEYKALRAVTCLDEMDAAIKAKVEGFHSGRAAAAALATKAHVERRDVVRLFAATDGALDWIKSALRVCSAAFRFGRDVHVRNTDAQVQEVCGRARPEHLEAERRFWLVLSEAVETFVAAEKKRIEAGLPEEPVTENSFPTDLRLQPLTDGPPEALVRTWRVSWRNGTNWLSTPTLLLDATADVEVTRLLYHGREVVRHEAPLDLNLRVVMVADRSYSPSSMYPEEDLTDPENARKQATAKKLREQVMDLLSMVIGAHGNGRTVVATTKGIRDRFHKEWKRPGVADPVHYGALRGLDFAKGHLAACGVGRTEQTIPVLDGLVAALVFDKPDRREHPYNRRGDMKTADGKPLFRTKELRTIRVRSGHDVRLSVPCMPTDLARRVESLWREAEVCQFLGRLRGVHRPDAAFVLLLCDCPPEGLLVDDLLTLAEALGPDALAWRTFDGLMLPGVSEARTGLTAAQVASFVARYRDWPAMRTVTCTAPDGTEVVGLAAAWVHDVPAALRKAGAPEAMIAAAVVSELRVDMVPSVPRSPDAMMQAEAVREGDFEVWQVSNRQDDDETDRGYRARFVATYDPEEYEIDPADEREPEPTTRAAVDEILRRGVEADLVPEEEWEPC